MTRLLALAALPLSLIACSGVFPADPDGGPDAGDAGPADARPPDAGTPDGGPPDAGSLSCDDAVYDPVLGTARLGAGYRIVDSAILPFTSFVPVAAQHELLQSAVPVLGIYGYAGNGTVHRLGTWPQLSSPAATNTVFDAIPTEDRALQFLTAPLLPAADGELLAAYQTIRGGGFVDGGISLFDTTRPDAGTRWLAAPGVESALALGSFFLVGGDDLGGIGGTRGVYGVHRRESVLRPVHVASYPQLPDENVRPGLMALTSNGVVLMGYYLDVAGRHSVRLPEPAAVATALSGGSPIDLTAAPELSQADDIANLTSFGQGAAVLHAKGRLGIFPTLGRLEQYALIRVDGGTTVGTPVPVLASDDACTAVTQLVPVAGGLELIVGLWDARGQRLLRIAAR